MFFTWGESPDLCSFGNCHRGIITTTHFPNSIDYDLEMWA